MTARGPNYGWFAYLSELAKDSPGDIREGLVSFVRDASREQVEAWRQAIPVVRDAARRTVESFPAASAHSLLMEYELPREGGRRPDVVVLGNGTIIVVEFKGKDVVQRADLDQVAAYARDLRCYHSQSHGRTVIPALVPMRYTGPRTKYDDVEVVPPAELHDFVEEVARTSAGDLLDGREWALSSYEPLPGLVEAARYIFENRPLPFIRRANSAGIPQAVEHLATAAHEASRTGTRHLVLLTGVPGAGKTLVGLQLVHDKRLGDLVEVVEGRPKGAPAVFLSGNGPLVQVLQHALRGESGEEKIFVNGIKSYLKQYMIRKRPVVPPEHIVVFDEAQRAWDTDTIREKHEVEASEPELVIRLADSIPRWSLVLGLVGEGQEIHKGEEAGLRQWADAVRMSPAAANWVVHGPERLAALFPSPPFKFLATSALDLTTTLRSHLSSNVHGWVDGLLTSRLSPAELTAQAQQIRSEGFVLYLTRDLGQAADYVRDRYEGQVEKRFGLIASSRAKNLEVLGVDNTYNATKRLKVGPWYNDSPSSPFSCCRLQTVVTEFQAQGLELDCPIVCWGDDFYRSNERWKVAPRRLNKSYKDPELLRLNSYRVLLTRGRDGCVLFVPPEHGDGMDATAAHLTEAGVLPL